MVSSNSTISFDIDESKWIEVIYTKFNGATTDFSQGNAFLEAIPDMTLERTLYGKIIFKPIINLTIDAKSKTNDCYNRYIDLDGNVELHHNYLSINTINLTTLDEPATISLYNLDFNKPTIMRNGVVCPDNICNLISNVGGVVTFNVSTFADGGNTYYSISEYSPSLPSSGGGGVSGGGGAGGGGGGVSTENKTNVTKLYNFSVSPNFLSFEMKPGDFFEKSILITNTGTQDLSIKFDFGGLKRFFSSSSNSVLVKSNSRENVFLKIHIPKTEKPDIYLGEITFSSRGITRKIDVIVHIKPLPKKPLFDLRTIVLRKYVNPGTSVPARISITNLKGYNNLNVSLFYAIKNFKNQIISSNSENFIMNKSISKEVSLKTHMNDKIGRYIFYSRVSHLNETATSYDTFSIERISFVLWLLIFLMVLIMIVIVGYLIWRNRKLIFKNKKKSKL